MGFQTSGKHASSFVVGSEGGHLFRCSLKEGRTRVQPPADALSDGWTPEGWALLCRLRSADRDGVRKIVEQHARDQRLTSIGPADIYASQPPQEKLFPSPIDFAYDPHGALFVLFVCLFVCFKYFSFFLTGSQHSHSLSLSLSLSLSHSPSLAHTHTHTTTTISVGPVHSISCSPFHRNLFLSCGADGIISLYSLLQAKPLLTMDPSPTYILAVSWSKVRPLVFTATTEDGVTFLYDLGVSTTSYVVEIHSGAKAGDTSTSLEEKNMDHGGAGDYGHSSKRSATTCVAFNPRQRALFATGNSNGTIHLWRLPPTLSTSVAKEEQQLLTIVRGLEDGDAIAASKRAASKAKRAKGKKKGKKKESSGGGGDASKK